MYEIIIGRDQEQRRKLGLKGTILIGKSYVQMGNTHSLANNVYLDIASSHVVYVCGKRGSGKSYTLGVIAEGIASISKEIAQNLSVIILDTMGIYWTMKYPNKKDKNLLEKWELKPEGFKQVRIYVPKGFYEEEKKQGVPVDYEFSINPMDLNSEDWLELFGIDQDSEIGVLISEIVSKKKQEGKSYDIDGLIAAIKQNKDFEEEVKRAAIARFNNVKLWGLFSKKATSIEEIARPGQITIIDISCYSSMPNGWTIKSLVVGLVAEKLFLQRMHARKIEEFKELEHEMHEFSKKGLQKQRYPLVWLFLDEAHEFLPRDYTTLASKPLITVLREGRQPGISLVLATQQPGKIHTDVITQSDIVISHRVTAQVDVKALEALTQTYMQESLVQSIDKLPREKGAAVVFDDTNERLFALRIRPRITWHGGSSPVAVHEETTSESIFDEE